MWEDLCVNENIIMNLRKTGREAPDRIHRVQGKVQSQAPANTVMIWLHKEQNTL